MRVVVMFFLSFVEGVQEKERRKEKKKKKENRNKKITR